MKLGSALFLAYVLIFALCFSYPMAHMASSLRTRYLEGAEEPLVDQANLLAGIVGREMETGGFDAKGLFETLEGVYARPLSARIYEMRKDHVDAQVYITDAAGKVVFDSADPGKIGADYSEWQDVRLTLKGEYGARTTRVDPEDPTTAVLFVAAPILLKGEIAGVLTVAKPTTSVNAFLKSAKPRIFRIGALSALVAVSSSLLVSFWLSGQIRRLTRYADDVRGGRRVDLPKLARTELKEMGDAFDKMRESLEGKKYVERYVETLTHEIKSPVSAIRGAAELLEEDMPPETQAQFLSNIRSESDRIQDLVERMLKLSELETRRSLDAREAVALPALIREVLRGKEAMLSRKKLQVQADVGKELVVRGDRFLLQQAISNLVQNAIDFSPSGGRIALRTEADGAMLAFSVDDEGPGVPDYAREKVFERFFSLQRPDTGKKSTGLGLNLVKEVAALHEGEIRLENLPAAGLRATLRVPASG